MLPRIEPLTVCLRQGSASVAANDALYQAWSSLSAAREVPFQSTEPFLWLRAFHERARAALEAFERHSEEADAPDSCLSELAGDARLARAIERQREDHARLRGRLKGLCHLTSRPANNALGHVVRANQDAALMQLYLGLHHRRLGYLLEQRKLTAPASPATPVEAGVRI